MANIQRYLEAFHKNIRIDFEISQELRDKRDIVLGIVRKHLDSNDLPAFKELHQGSYKLKTGVRPISNLEFDIDIGLRFFLEPSAFSSSDIRGWVKEAVDGHTKSVEEKGPCLRVNYVAGYHLDLVCYAVDSMGRYHLGHRDSGWRDADPKSLMSYVRDYRKLHFSGTEDSATSTDQFRRCIRYLRRWSDIRFSTESDQKPTGLAFVLLAAQGGLGAKTFLDGSPDDRAALYDFTLQLSSQSGRLQALKPTPEYEDLLGRLSDKSMDILKSDLKTLAQALCEAGKSEDAADACLLLRPFFGDELTGPSAQKSALKTSAPAIITSSSSA